MGILSFMDTMFNYGEYFRRVNSVVFLLISLGLLVRISLKIKLRRFEGLVAKVEQLESELARFRKSHLEIDKPQKEDYKSGSEVHAK